MNEEYFIVTNGITNGTCAVVKGRRAALDLAAHGFKLHVEEKMDANAFLEGNRDTFYLQRAVRLDVNSKTTWSGVPYKEDYIVIVTVRKVSMHDTMKEVIRP